MTIRRSADSVRRSALLGLVASLLLMAGCGDRAPTDVVGKVSTSGTAADLKTIPADRLRHGGDIPFERSWDLTLPQPVHLSWISPEIPELLFLQLANTHEIYAIDAFSGRTRWISDPLPKPLAVAPHAARVVMPSGKAGESINDDRLYVISDDVIFCLDAVYGELVWRFPLPFSTSAGPHAVGPDGNLRVYIGDWAGRIQVVTWDRSNGLAYRLWQYPVFAPVTAPAVEYDNLVYVGDQGGKVTCFDLDREVKWSFPAGGKVLGSPDPVARMLLVGTTDNIFYALNRLSGEELARVHLNAPVTRSPFHFHDDPGFVYAWTTHEDSALGGLWAFEARSDQLEITHNLDAQNRPRKKEVLRLSKRFFVPGATRLVSSTPEHLYVSNGDTSTVVRAINRTTGNLDWAWDLNERKGDKGTIVHVTPYQDPSDLNRSIFTVDSENQLVAYRLFGYKPKDQVVMGAVAP